MSPLLGVGILGDTNDGDVADVTRGISDQCERDLHIPVPVVTSLLLELSWVGLGDDVVETPIVIEPKSSALCRRYPRIKSKIDRTNHRSCSVGRGGRARTS